MCQVFLIEDLTCIARLTFHIRDSLGKRKNIFRIAAKNFTYAPGLCIATTAVMWCISIKDFGDGTNTSIIKLFLYRFEVITCLQERFFGVMVYFGISSNKTTHQIAPDSTLMVSSISFWKRTAVDRMIIFVIP